MFQSFTGSSKRPRQVNLSGRHSNPFGAASQGSSPHGALASAQQERAQRQKERERLQKAQVLQKVWRGTSSRMHVRRRLREEYDEEEQSMIHSDVGTNSSDDLYSPDLEMVDRGLSIRAKSYKSEQQALAQVRRLVRFMERNNRYDQIRTARCSARMAVSDSHTWQDGSWPYLLMRLQRTVLTSMKYSLELPASLLSSLTDLLRLVRATIPRQTASDSDQYYDAMLQVAARSPSAQALEVALLPLENVSTSTSTVYESFAFQFLAPAARQIGAPSLAWLAELTKKIDYEFLARAIVSKINRDGQSVVARLVVSEDAAGLLGYFIYFHRHAHRSEIPSSHESQKDFVAITSILMSVLIPASLPEGGGESAWIRGVDSETAIFLSHQIYSLVDQESIRRLLSSAGPAAQSGGRRDNNAADARELANYALALIRFFPQRGDEIRMWLYLGSTADNDRNGSSKNVSAIKYFWQATQSASVFQTVTANPRSAIQLLKAERSAMLSDASRKYSWEPPHSERAEAHSKDDDWRVITMFMELYTFVLKVMDDEEFFAGSKSNFGIPTGSRPNALTTNDLQNLTCFLKNLGFTMYFHGADITGDNQPRDRDTSGSLANYFSVSSNASPKSTESETSKVLATVDASIDTDHLRGLTTGLLRMIYERDSRRKFLPKDHWLMTSQFNMEGFISAVVEEEESRSRVQEEDDEDQDNDHENGNTHDLDDIMMPNLVGTRRTQRQRETDRLQRQQRKASRKRYLQQVAPRLEILQNLPFFIPFTTRVQIFREFVHIDMMKRRRGYADPETWRMMIMHGPGTEDTIERHRAEIRRGQEARDAFHAFYGLGEGLKEPIQITFVNKFGETEAGIDGGGVTKEFLTSVTSEAFKADTEVLFIENDQHLLYPNPAKVDEVQDYCHSNSLSNEDSRSILTQLLQYYEFLGRVIGKCLYEGILVDISFAPFFLLKWSLTGGKGSAPSESGYRANINDLRDLDEALYQGLLQLKNYSGDVEEDFGLTFSVTDTITTEPKSGVSKTITRDLKPDGANTPVTNSNRLVYISYMARHRLQNQPFRQTNAFLRGLSTMIQPSWLSMFNQSELQTLVSGTSSSINIPDLRANTAYGGLYVIGNDGLEHPTVQLFWRVMESLSDEDRRKVVKFVTSTPRAPLLGFGALVPRFSIRDSGEDERRLPTTSTCVNLLKLPRYKTMEGLREKLLYAVNSGAGFDLS